MAIRASIQLASRQLDWTLSTTEVFEYFAKDEWAILLDSASASHQDAKFDIICAAPIATLVTKGERSEITLMQSDLTLPANTNVTDDPFELVNSLLNHWYPNALESGFPLQEAPWVALVTI